MLFRISIAFNRFFCVEVLFEKQRKIYIFNALCPVSAHVEGDNEFNKFVKFAMADC